MDSMEIGQFLTFSNSFFLIFLNFTKEVNWYFFTILHGGNNGWQAFKGVS